MLSKLWGDNYFDSVNEIFTKKNTAVKFKRGFVQFILEPISEIICSILNETKNKNGESKFKRMMTPEYNLTLNHTSGTPPHHPPPKPLYAVLGRAGGGENHTSSNPPHHPPPKPLYAALGRVGEEKNYTSGDPPHHPPLKPLYAVLGRAGGGENLTLVTKQKNTTVKHRSTASNNASTYKGKTPTPPPTTASQLGEREHTLPLPPMPFHPPPKLPNTAMGWGWAGVRKTGTKTHLKTPPLPPSHLQTEKRKGSVDKNSVH